MSNMRELYERPAIACKGAAVAGSAVTIAAFSFTAAQLADAHSAIITARTGGVMITWDGTAPTATLGHLIGKDQSMALYGNSNLAALKLIREASTSADVTITLQH